MNAREHPFVKAIFDAFPGAVILEDTMTDPTEHQKAAILAAGVPAGEYLDSLGKTDLATLSQDEWHTLLEVIVTGYYDALIRAKQPVPQAPA